MAERKAKHLEICLDDQQYAIEGGDSGFGNFRFIHRALPELSAQDIDTSLDFLGYRVSMPLFISSMTGGSDSGFLANRHLASIAQTARIPVGMGSIRILFRKPEVLAHFTLKKLAPDVPVVANLGAVQVRDMVHNQIFEMLKRLEVDGIAIHLNPAQELFQPEGDRDFHGILDSIRRFCHACPVPVIVKETGCGIGAQEAVRLLQSGVAYVNIAGSGGTNWVSVERYRAQGVLATAADQFRNWGNPTALVLAGLRSMEEQNRLPYTNLKAKTVHQTIAIQAADRSVQQSTDPKNKSEQSFRGILGGRILASGGIRTGMDFALSIALGAWMAGTALPFIRAVNSGGPEAGLAYAETMRTVLKNIMTLTSSHNLSVLRTRPLLINPSYKETIDQYIRAMGVA